VNRTISRTQLAEYAGIIPGRIYDLIAGGLLRPERLTDGGWLYTTKDAEIAKVAAGLIDRGVLPDCVHRILARLHPYEDPRDVREHAQQLAAVSMQGMWLVFDLLADPESADNLQTMTEGGAVDRVVMALT